MRAFQMCVPTVLALLKNTKNQSKLNVYTCTFKEIRL